MTAPTLTHLTDTVSAGAGEVGHQLGEVGHQLSEVGHQLGARARHLADRLPFVEREPPMRRLLRTWSLPVVAAVVAVVLVAWLLSRRESGDETEAEPADESTRSRFERRYAGVGD